MFSFKYVIFFLPPWKEKVVSYISKIKSNVYRHEDVIEFFESNIEYFEYLKLCALNVVRRQSRTGDLFYYQWPGFHHALLLVILRGK